MRFELGQKLIDKIRHKKTSLEKCREQIIKTAKRCGTNLWIGGYSYVTPQTELGDYVCFTITKKEIF